MEMLFVMNNQACQKVSYGVQVLEHSLCGVPWELLASSAILKAFYDYFMFFGLSASSVFGVPKLNSKEQLKATCFSKQTCIPCSKKTFHPYLHAHGGPDSRGSS